MSTLPATGFVGFALIALGMVLTPGPNMVYLISRSICQGRVAGLISLGGVALGFVFYMASGLFSRDANLRRRRLDVRRDVLFEPGKILLEHRD